MRNLAIDSLEILGIVCILVIPARAQDSWQWNAGNGLLNPSQIDVVPPSSPQVYDIDNDSDLDLIIGEGDGTISLYLNNDFPHDTEWTRDTSYFSTFDFQYAVVPTLQDLNNDDSLELVVSFKNFDRMPLDSIKTYRNRGTNSNPEWQEIYGYFDIYSDLIPSVTDQKFDDWDLDGDLDMLARCWIDTMYLFYRNIGSPGNPNWIFDSTMSEAFRFDVGPCGYEGFEVADLTNDGAFDIVMSGIVCDGPDMVIAFINRGTNQAPQYPIYEDFDFFPGSGYFYTALTSGDIDGDGDFDLMSGGSFPIISFYRNNGNASSPLFNGQGNLNMGPFFINQGRDFTFLDRDLDSDADLAGLYTYMTMPIPYYFMAWCVFDNSGTHEQPRFVSARWLWDYLLPVVETGLSSGDLNGDSRPDMAWGFDEYIIAEINGADFTFHRDDSIFAEINSLGDYQHPELADLNQDGLLDLVALDLSTQALSAFENTGTAIDPSWILRPQLISGINMSASYANACDLDGNGLTDFILKAGNALEAYLNIGAPGAPSYANAPQVLSGLQGLRADYIDIADLDGDGDDDMIISNDGTFIFIENQSVVGIHSEESRPISTSGLSNFPNPFNTRTSISFTLAGQAHVTLTVYDIAGKRAAKLYDGQINAGTHSMVWDGRNSAGQDVSSGIYFSRLNINGATDETHRMVLLK